MNDAVTGEPAAGIDRLDLGSDEVLAVHEMVSQLGREIDDIGCGEFLDELVLHSFRLPQRVVRALLRFRYAESSAALVLSGFPISQAALPPTPAHWRERDPHATREADIMLLLVGGLLGQPFGWRSLQEGRLLNDILPIRGAETAQTGHGSAAPLELHCEDAFHDYRCDYLLLMCLRNRDGTACTVSTADELDLAPAVRDVLFQPRYVIRPDEEHINRAAENGAAAVREHSADPPAVCALFGAPDAPYLRIDPPYMTTHDRDDIAAAEALAELVRRLADNVRDVVLRPGEILLVDNYRAVHGRRSFSARYDGTDRWHRRLVVSRDLRRSRALRSAPNSALLQ